MIEESLGTKIKKGMESIERKVRELRKKAEDEYALLEQYYQGTGFKMSFKAFIASVFVTAVIVLFVFWLLHIRLLIGIISFASIMSMTVSFPISIRNSRIREVEEALPDALKHMSSILKSGGTTESALAEVADADYGPVSLDLKKALNQLQEGRNFDDALTYASTLSGSALFRKATTIIIDARQSGAGLADVMDSIAEDLRDIIRIKRERYSRTLMQVMFLYGSALLLSPMIFGFVLSIVCYIGSGMAAATTRAGEVASVDLRTLSFIITIFMVASAVFAAVGTGIIREGKASRYLLYVPVMILMVLVIFEVGKWLSGALIGGSAACLL